MFVGSYRIELHFPESRSLKAKRSVLNRLKSRLSQLNLSVAEVEGQDKWQRSSYRLRLGPTFFAEIGLLIYALICVGICFSLGKFWAIPFLLLYVGGFGVMTGIDD